MTHPKVDYFESRTLAIASRHDKHKVIGPLVENALGVRTVVPEDLDTDSFGTFTGEVERKDDPITTLRNKCLVAMQKSNCNLAIASEGSFGPHPTLFVVPGDDELLMLLDGKHNLEIISRELSTETNFAGRQVKTENELTSFAHEVHFPSHGLILRDEKDSKNKIIKGITDWQKLRDTFNELMQAYGTVYAETDMRAMYNPTRMKVIEKATEKLIDKIKSCCPVCDTPGFGVTQVKAGLPCRLCGSPTPSTLSYLYACSRCAYTEEKMFPNNKKTEDPGYCQSCNP